MNLKASAFDTRFGSKVSQRFKRFDEFRPAVRIAAVIDRVYTNKNVSGRNYFRPAERKSEKDGVPRGDIGDRNSIRDFCLRSIFRHTDIIRERRAAEHAHVDFCETMLFCA